MSALYNSLAFTLSLGENHIELRKDLVQVFFYQNVGLTTFQISLLILVGVKVYINWGKGKTPIG